MNLPDEWTNNIDLVNIQRRGFSTESYSLSLISIQLSISLIGIVLNTILLIAMYKYTKSVEYLFNASILFVNLILGIILFIVSVGTLGSESSVLSLPYMCHVVSSINDCSQYLSAICFMAIAVFNWKTIVKHSAYNSCKCIAIFLSIIWAIAIAITVVSTATHNLSASSSGVVCYPFGKNELASAAMPSYRFRLIQLPFVFVKLILLILTPVVVGISYTLIYIHVHRVGQSLKRITVSNDAKSNPGPSVNREAAGALVDDVEQGCGAFSTSTSAPKPGSAAFIVTVKPIAAHSNSKSNLPESVNPSEMTSRNCQSSSMSGVSRGSKFSMRCKTQSGLVPSTPASSLSTTCRSDEFLNRALSSLAIRGLVTTLVFVLLWGISMVISFVGMRIMLNSVADNGNNSGDFLLTLTHKWGLGIWINTGHILYIMTIVTTPIVFIACDCRIRQSLFKFLGIASSVDARITTDADVPSSPRSLIRWRPF
ncbi:hypothetical protein RTP6_003387 [Batrachochytrium dendrobatidis]